MVYKILHNLPFALLININQATVLHIEVSVLYVFSTVKCYLQAFSYIPLENHL